MNLSEKLFESFLVRPEGLPIIEPVKVESWIKSNEQVKNKTKIWRSLGNYWVETLAESLNDQYWLLDSDNFCILTLEEDNVAQRFGYFCENAYKIALSQMGQIASRHPYGCYYILIFDDIDNYYRYISPLFPEESNLAQSSGVFISSGYPHFALPSADISNMEAVVSHELSHAVVSHLELPVWLDEGIAQKMEELILRDIIKFEISAERAEKHRIFWNSKRIKEFWSGESFAKAGDSNELSYELARIMIDLISEDKKRFINFVKNIGSTNTGEKAAKKYLGKELEEALFGFLGPIIPTVA